MKQYAKGLARFLRMPIFVLGFSAPIMLPGLIMALVWEETGMIRGFGVPMIAALAASLPVFMSLRKEPIQIAPKDGFLLVFLTWSFISLLGGVPYVLSGRGISFTDGVFESACGFATTGATTIADVESLPRSLLFWRSLTHWFGGMGILLLTVALMPLLGVGGFQLIKAEAPGPEKEKVTPKITATAKILWLVYFGFTLALFLLYLAGGMPWFDALCHGLATMATGGVSTKNPGIGFYDSPFIDGVTTVFMLLGGFNFNLYYRLIQGKFTDLTQNTEAKVYLCLFLGASGIIAFSIFPIYGSAVTAIRYAAYQTASFITTTGAAITDYEAWPPLAQGMLFLLMFTGGCSGSTSGGIKLIRHAVLFKQMGNELRRLIYPQGVFSVQLNRKVGRKDVVYGVAGFMFLYFLVVGITTLITAASGTDVFSAFSAALSVTGNFGAGFGAVGPAHHYGGFPDHVKWLFSFVMIAGRLELWTVFILFTPEYWQE
jgi:trk system potassium uptake protein TrkH